MGDLGGKTALVTGAASGIGFATVEMFARRGPDKKTSTGFTFLEYSPVALMNALTRALIVFGDAPRWRALQVAGMLQDFSWDRSAREYVKLYERALRSGAD